MSGLIRASMRTRLERLRGEAQLLAMAMFVCFVGFLCALPQELARLPGDASVQGIGWLFTGSVFFGPLLLIGLASLSHLIARAFGGQATWQQARLALFWALCLALPLLVINSFVKIWWLEWICFAGTLWIWAETLSEAEGFPKTWKTFATMLGPPVLLAAIA